MAKDKVERSTVQLIINGEQSKVSLKELGIAAQQLKKEFREMKEADDPAAWAKKAEEVKKTSQAYADAKDRVKDLTSSFKQMKTNWKDMAMGFLAGTVLTQVLDTAAASLGKLKDKVYDMSDSLADVAKSADMSKGEVRALNGELSKINTRTTTEELRKIAEMGGKFGVAKEELEGFTESTDKLNVAFGDQFGSVEELADTTLKLRNIFLDIKSDNIGDDVLHIGNAMNVLEAQGAATGQGMADFAGRMGGTLIPLGATSGQVLGLSATLEELNVTAERGSTAVNSIFQKMLTNVEGFAKVAGMSTKDFSALIEKDIFQAFVKFTEGSKRGGESAIAFAKILEDTELQGSGASEVLMKLGSNTEMLATKVGTVTTALGETNSVLSEFEKKNNNAAAVMDKLGKIFDNILEKTALLGMDMVEAFGGLLGLTDKLGQSLTDVNAQQDKLATAESKLPPLIARYNELKKQASLNKDEQKELNTIIQSITDTVPEAATQFDKYGNALDINQGKVRDYIESQRGLLETMRQTRRELLKEDASDLMAKAIQLQSALNKGSQTKVLTGPGGSMVVEEKFLPEQIKQMQADLARVRADLQQRRQDLKGLEGIADINERRAGRGYGVPEKKGLVPPATDPAAPTGTPAPTGTETGKKAKKKKEPKDTSNMRYAGVKDMDFSVAPKDLTSEVEGKVKASYERQLGELESLHGLSLYDLAEQQVAGKLSPEQAYNEKLLAQEKYLTAKLLLQRTYGQDALATEKELNNMAIQQMEMRVDMEKELKEALKEAEWELQDTKREALAQGLSVMKGFFGETSLMAKGFFVLEKAIAIADIIVKTQREIAAYKVAAANQMAAASIAGPLAPGLIAAISAITAKQVASATIRAGVAIGTIGAQTIQSFIPGREQGGYTDMASLRKSTSPAGYVDKPTLFQLGARSFIAGENYKKEYVIPGHLLDDPAIGAAARQIEYYRTTGTKPRAGQMAQGGGDGQMEQLLITLIDETRATRQALETGKVKTQFNYRTFEEFQDLIDFVRKETST